MKAFQLHLLLPAALRLTLAYTTLSDESLKALSSPGAAFDIKEGSILAPILKPRVPGTRGSEEVLFHFVDWFQTNLPRWKLSFQNSTSKTPTSGTSEIPFTNLIATRDPPWIKRDGEVGRLALVAHYDSKLKPDGFIGATDSAAPCAMIMHAAQNIDAALTKKWNKMEADGVHDVDLEGHTGVQLLLLDGEEAFMTWTHDDSLYGARALAEEWDATVFPAMSTYSSPLASIDLFVLLDLLGSSSPKVPSYFKTTHWAYKRMAEAEARLRKLGKFQSSSSSLFLPEAAKDEEKMWLGGMVEDDHVPFMLRGVEILHLIPSPFPRVWHTMDDDGEHLDMPATEDWAVLTAAFAAEWLELEGFLDTAGTSKDKRGSKLEEKSEL